MRSDLGGVIVESVCFGWCIQAHAEHAERTWYDSAVARSQLPPMRAVYLSKSVLDTTPSRDEAFADISFLGCPRGKNVDLGTEFRHNAVASRKRLMHKHHEAAIQKESFQSNHEI